MRDNAERVICRELVPMEQRMLPKLKTWAFTNLCLPMKPCSICLRNKNEIFAIQITQNYKYIRSSTNLVKHHLSEMAHLASIFFFTFLAFRVRYDSQGGKMHRAWKEKSFLLVHTAPSGWPPCWAVGLVTQRTERLWLVIESLVLECVQVSSHVDSSSHGSQTQEPIGVMMTMVEVRGVRNHPHILLNSNGCLCW